MLEDATWFSTLSFWLVAIVVMLLFAAVILGFFAVLDELPRWRSRRATTRRIETLLNGRDKATMLAQAPYEFFYAQGDDHPQLGNRNTGERYAEFMGTELEAELWIIERHLADMDGNSAESSIHNS